MKNRSDKISWLIDKPIAHRGLHNSNGRPENSYAAFDEAIRLGLPIELDLQLTSDGQIVVFHDESLNRMTGVNERIDNTDLKFIRNLKLSESEQSIPVFKEFLEYVNGKVPLLIEIKNFGKTGYFEQKVIDDLINYNGKFAIQSFNPFTLRWLKINNPEIIRGQISSKFRHDEIPLHYKQILKNLTFNFSTKPDFINYHIEDLPYFPVNYYKKRGIKLLAWTVRTNEQLKKAKEMCDNFVFEELNPAEIVK